MLEDIASQFPFARALQKLDLRHTAFEKLTPSHRYYDRVSTALSQIEKEKPSSFVREIVYYELQRRLV